MLALITALVLITSPLDVQQQPYFPGLGSHARKITAANTTAARYFNQGLNFLFAFNHDEAIRSFQAAAKADPNCKMAYWGIAMANGPHINNPSVDEEHAAAAWDATQRALSCEGKFLKVERDLVESLLSRYSKSQPADRSSLDRTFADKMRALWKRYPRDADIGAIFAESMMDLRPWDLWQANGAPQPGTAEIVKTLEQVIKLNPKHPLGLHLYIHAVEASPNPERAKVAAERLRTLQPGLGHMTHMPSHIDVRTGEWKKAILANERAIASDREYRKLKTEQGFYRIYMIHNHQMLAYAAMMCGRYERAKRAAQELNEVLPPEFLESIAPLADGYMPFPMEISMRFGKWDDVLAFPEFAEYFPIAQTMRHGLRAIAYAAKGDLENARLEQRAYFDTKLEVPKDGVIGNNAASDVLLVLTHLMNGEILLAMDAENACLQNLRSAVDAEMKLRYNEPPDWLQPARHTLGAALLKYGHYKEAERVYRDDLKKIPNNGWSLFGLAQAFKSQGKNKESQATAKKFAVAWKDADMPIHSSCLCVKPKD